MGNVAPTGPSGRIVSLDQFRGYTVAGMFVVNFLASYAACPRILKHTNDYCSYADTIMPQFLFAVGFAFRLTFERRVQREGARAAFGRVVRRLLGLAGLALAIYVLLPTALEWPQILTRPAAETAREIFKRDWFQTLLHIAVTSLWILPVIRASLAVRIAFAAASAVLHVALSGWFYFVWVNTPPAGIDGGPLGFLTWTLPAIAGTVGCDLVAAAATAAKSPVRPLALAGAALMLLGWGLSCGTRLYDVPASDRTTPLSKIAASPVVPPGDAPAGRPATALLAEPPFVPPPPASERQWNYWMMSQRAGTLSYLTFAAGFSMALFAGFYFVCDQLGKHSALFQTFGVNPLAGYVLHDPIGDFTKWLVPRSSSAPVMWLACAAYFLVVWALLKLLERRGMFFRL